MVAAMPRYSLAIAWLLLIAAAQVSAEPNAGRLGDLAYDVARWKVESVADGFRITSLRDNHNGVSISVRIAPGEPSGCRDDLMMKNSLPSQHPESQVLRKSGFDIHVASGWTGCRNARPPSVLACTAYKGNVYRFDSRVVGCSGGPGFGDGALDFLSGLSGVR
jgi:hypothetical protein